MNAGRHNHTGRDLTAECRATRSQGTSRRKATNQGTSASVILLLYPPSGTPFRSSRSPVRRQRLDYRKQTMDRLGRLMIRSQGRKPESGKVAPICCRCRHAGSNVTHAPAPEWYSCESRMDDANRIGEGQHCARGLPSWTRSY